MVKQLINDDILDIIRQMYNYFDGPGSDFYSYYFDGLMNAFRTTKIYRIETEEIINSLEYFEISING